MNIILCGILSDVSHLRLGSVALCAAFSVVGCDLASQQMSRENSKQQVVQSFDADWRELLRSLPESSAPLLPVQLPADLRTHSEQNVESFEARWALKSVNGKVFSVFAQLDRVKVKAEADSKSLWSFNDVARSTIASGSQDDSALVSREIFSRVALGLAESRGDEFLVGSTSMKLNQASSEQQNSEQQNSEQQNSEQTESCRRSIEFSHVDNRNSTITLSSKAEDCPQSASLGSFNQWQFDAMPTTGTFADETVEGVLWLTHRWGSSANFQAAVVLDQLRLALQNTDGRPQWVDITRSKRRSGRGPKTTLATIRDNQGRARNSTLTWDDSGEVVSSATGNVYPETIRIQDTSIGLDIVLTPAVELSEIRDSFQTRWSGALVVSGSHTGMAYLDFVPLPITTLDSKS